MSEITITTATILLALSTVLLLLITVGSYILFGNNQGNFIIVTSLLFAGIASYAAATDMGIPTSVRPNSMFRGNLSDTAAAMTSGLFAFIMSNFVRTIIINITFGLLTLCPPKIQILSLHRYYRISHVLYCSEKPFATKFTMLSNIEMVES